MCSNLIPAKIALDQFSYMNGCITSLITEVGLFHGDSFYSERYTDISPGLEKDRMLLFWIPVGEDEFLGIHPTYLRMWGKDWNISSQETVPFVLFRGCSYLFGEHLETIAQGLDSNLKLSDWLISTSVAHHLFRAKSRKILPPVDQVGQSSLEKWWTVPTGAQSLGHGHWWLVGPIFICTFPLGLDPAAWNSAYEAVTLCCVKVTQAPLG